MGEMQVPASAYYGAQTARAVENFPISNLRFSRQFIRALGLIKKQAAITNAALGLLPAKTAQAIQQAAQEVIDGKLDEHFVVDIFQTGSGTSTNMNVNEVIANRATELLGDKLGSESKGRRSCLPKLLSFDGDFASPQRRGGHRRLEKSPS